MSMLKLLRAERTRQHASHLLALTRRIWRGFGHIAHPQWCGSCDAHRKLSLATAIVSPRCANSTSALAWNGANHAPPQNGNQVQWMGRWTAQFGAADMRLHGLVEARQKKHALLPQAKCPKHRQVHCVTTVWQPAPDCEPTSERVEEVDAHFGNVNLCLEA